MVWRAIRIFRRDRILRFFEVWRSEGGWSALAATFRQLAMAAQGQVPTVVSASGTTLVPGTCALTAVWTDLARNDAFHVTVAPAVNRRRRHVAMIGDLNLPQCKKYRVEQLDELWNEAGVGYTYAHHEDIPRCLDILQGATHLMLYRLRQSSVVEMYLYEARRLRIPIIYDIDDPLFSFSAYETYSNGAGIDARMRRQLIDQSPAYLATMMQADMLTLSTPGLVELAGLHCPRQAYLRRNFADRPTLELGGVAMRAAPSKKGFTLVFASGSQGHELDLLSIADALEDFLAGDPSRTLLILGTFDQARLPQTVAERTVMRPFADYPSYLRALASADCAILPLCDDAFNRCKSAVRVIDAASVGVPSVVGTVGDGGAVVRDGVTGFTVAAGGWRDAFETFARDPLMATQLGREARRDLETRWAVSQRAPIVDPAFLAEVMH